MITKALWKHDALRKKNMLVALVTQSLFSSSLALSRLVVYLTADRSLPIVRIFSEVSFFFNPRWVVEHLKRVLVFPFKFPAPVSILKGLNHLFRNSNDSRSPQKLNLSNLVSTYRTGRISLLNEQIKINCFNHC